MQADAEALFQDRIALNQIKEELNSLKPDFQCIKATGNELTCTPHFDSSLSLDKNLAITDLSINHSDRKLTTQTEERDYLLKKGNQLSDDSMITELNSKIKSLLMNGL